MSLTYAMKPCPSCKSRDLTISVVSHNPSMTRTFVNCQTCGFEGPIVINDYVEKNVNQAITCWDELPREGE